MDSFWSKARSLADDAAKRTQDLTAGASRLSAIVTSQADQLLSQAASRADELRRLASSIGGSRSESDLEAFGVTEELIGFVQGITPTTFLDFPLEDDTLLYDVDTLSNVRQDLSEWQESHAAIVLSAVKEISKLRYELCPRFMKERKFWRIYFILMNSHVAPYEKMHMDKNISKTAERVKDDVGEVKDDTVAEDTDETVKDPVKVELSSKPEANQVNEQSKTLTSSSTEQDLDAFLLGDFIDGEDGSDDNGGNTDDDFDKMLDGLDDDEKVTL